MSRSRNIAGGGATSGRVPSTGQFGYLKLAPSGELTPAQLAEVFRQQGPLGGPVATTLHVAGSEQRVRLTRVDVDVAPASGGGDPEFAAAARGTPILPRDGAWSVARKLPGATNAAAPLPAGTAIPVIRRGRSTGPAPAASVPWQFADPRDLLAASPSSDYGFLQGTGTQAMFVQRPQIDEIKKAIVPPIPSSLADVTALLKTAGVFPPEIANFQLPSNFQLNPGPDGLTFDGAGAKYQIAIPPGTTNSLLDLGFIKVTCDFSDLAGTSTTITLELKPGRWSIVVSPVSFVLDLGPFPQILAVTGMFSGANGAGPSFSGLPATADPFGPRDQPRITYGSALSILTDLLTALKDLLSALGLPVELEVSFSGNTLTVKDSLPIPHLPLGLGSISGITLELGAELTLPDKVHFVAGISSPEAPFKWMIFPLAGNGCVQIAARDNRSDIVVQGGLGLGIAIDIGIAKGSASIILSVELDIGTTAFSIKGTLTGNAEVDVLGGLVGASLTLSAGLGIEVPFGADHIDVFADVSVGIHISICWIDRHRLRRVVAVHPRAGPLRRHAMATPTLSLLAFPQRWTARSSCSTSSSCRSAIRPRPIDLADGVAGAADPAFAAANLALDARLIGSLDQLPDTTAAHKTFALGVAAPAGRDVLYAQIKASFHVDPAPPPPRPRAALTSVKKHLPESYTRAFAFEQPRSPLATPDADFGCALRDPGGDPPKKKPPPSDLITWGKIISLCLRQPLLARAMGLLYSATITPDPADVAAGGWLYVALGAGGDYAAGVTGGQIASYAARLPPLAPGTPRPLCAAVLFPVTDVAGGIPLPAGNFDDVFLEAEIYDDGFTQIVHCAQPSVIDAASQDPDTLVAAADAGIPDRLGRRAGADLAAAPDLGGAGQRRRPPRPARRARLPRRRARAARRRVALAETVTGNLALGAIAIGSAAGRELQVETAPAKLKGRPRRKPAGLLAAAVLHAVARRLGRRR